MSHTQPMEERSESTARLSMVNIDRADPARLARYAAALVREVTDSDDTYGMVECNDIKIGFGQLDGFRSAQWLRVGDLDETTERLRALGVSQPDLQSGAGRRRVLLAPDGQPFCVRPRPVAIR